MTETESKFDRSTAPARRSIWQTGWVNTLGRFLALVVVFSFFALLVDDGKFVSSRNLENIARQCTVYAIAAIGMTLVIIVGGIDLSAGSIIALSVVVIAWILNLQTSSTEGSSAPPLQLLSVWPTLLPVLAILGGIAAGTLAGLANGCLIVGLRLVPFIITLGTMQIIRGIAKGIADDKDIYPPSESWVYTIMDPTLTSPDASRQWMLLPPGVWILIAAAVFAGLLLRYTRFGRHVYAVGSNEQTARLCGVPVERTKILVYMLAGLFSGLSAVMLFSDISIGQPTSAIAYELAIIAAVVIGGGSLLGGEGSILGSMIGALIITVLYMGGKQMDWPQWVQEAATGAIIIAAVALDRLRHRAAS
jgi:erythritol transport system permease protein